MDLSSALRALESLPPEQAEAAAPLAAVIAAGSAVVSHAAMAAGAVAPLRAACEELRESVRAGAHNAELPLRARRFGLLLGAAAHLVRGALQRGEERASAQATAHALCQVAVASLVRGITALIGSRAFASLAELLETDLQDATFAALSEPLERFLHAAAAAAAAPSAAGDEAADTKAERSESEGASAPDDQLLMRAAAALARRSAEFRARVLPHVLRLLRCAPRPQLRTELHSALAPALFFSGSGEGPLAPRPAEAAALLRMLREAWAEEAEAAARGASGGERFHGDLYGLVCAFFQPLAKSDAATLSALALELAWAALNAKSAPPLRRRQAVYLLRARLQHCNVAVAGDGYSEAQWNVFIMLWEAVSDTEAHLVHDTFRHISRLLDAPPSMSRWLELLVIAGLADRNLAVARTVAEALMHFLGGPGEAPAAAQQALCARLGPATATGAMLEFLNQPLLYRTELPTCELIARYLAKYIQLRGASVGPETALREFLAGLWRHTSSYVAASHQLDVLRSVAPSRALDEATLMAMLSWLPRFLVNATRQYRAFLESACAALVANHLDVASATLHTVARVLLCLQRVHARPGGPHFLVMQRTLLQPASSGAAPYLAARLREELPRFLSGDEAAAAAAADEAGSAALLSSEREAAQRLATALNFVPVGSPLERECIEAVWAPLLRAFSFGYVSPRLVLRSLALLVALMAEMDVAPDVFVTRRALLAGLVERSGEQLCARLEAALRPEAEEPYEQRALSVEAVRLVVALLAAASPRVAHMHARALTAAVAAIGDAQLLQRARGDSVLVLYEGLHALLAGRQSLSPVEAGALMMRVLAQAAGTAAAAAGLSGKERSERMRHALRSRWQLLALLAAAAPRPLPDEQVRVCLAESADGLASVADDGFVAVVEFAHAVLERVPIGDAPSPQLEQAVGAVLEGAWSSFSDLAFVNEEAAAALLSLVFHPTIFGAPAWHGEPAQSAPRRVVQRLVALGMTRHERVLRFAAFCGARAWVASPRVARLYVSEIVEMCTHTNHLDDFNSLAQWRTLSDKQLALETQSAPPAVAAAAAGGDDAPSPLMERFDPIYTAVWARARQPTFEGHALASPELRRLIAESVNQNPAASRLVSTESVVRCSLLLVMETLARREPRDAHSGALLRDLLRAGFASFPRLVHHFTPANAPNEGSTVHTRTLYLLQMLCVLVGGLDAAAAAEGESLPRLLEWTHDELWRVYDRNPFTTARHEIEMMLINVLRREPARLFPRALMARLRDLTARPVAKASAMLVAGFALRFAARPVDREALFLPVVQEMFPLLSSNFGYVRAIAQYFIHDLICACAPGVAAAAAAAGKAKEEEEEEEEEQEAKEEAAAAAASALGVSAQQFVVNTFRFLTVYPDTVKSRLRQEEYFARFDPLKRCTVAGILGDATDDRHYVPRPLIEAARAGLSEVLNSFRAEDEVLSRVDAAYRGIAAAAGSGQQQPAQAAAAEAAAAAAGAGAAAPSFFQKKAVPLDYLFEEGGESAADDETRRARFETERAARRREPLVVCASLLDKAPNLAGLTRTCEVFNAELLTVGDRAILESDLYVRAAVSAHKWMPVQEVPPAQIASFLAAMRAKGYKVVALEQAANSVPLERFVFPEKMVLLLGQERQGTPVELLSLVDACVEIPQFGVIRSLNVHVSASILIWERTRQRLLAGKLAK